MSNVPTTAMPPPRGVGFVCSERSFGRSSTPRRAKSGISARVLRHEAAAVAAAMAAAGKRPVMSASCHSGAPL